MPAPVLVWVANEVDQRTGGHVRRAKVWLVLVPVIAVAGTLLVSFAPVIEPAAAGSCGPGESVPSSADLPAPTLAAINKLKPEYEAAGAAKNVSWAILAGIDFRESMNDPNRSSLAGEPLGTANPDHPDRVMHTKAESLEASADYLRGLAADVYGVTVTATTGADDMKKALVAYGRGHLWADAGIDPDRSPYAMNGWDSAHTNMAWPTSPAEPLSGMVDTRLGALTIFARLGGPAGACGGLSDVELVRIAQGEIGNQEDPDGSQTGATIDKYRGSDPPEPWCAAFVSWVYREAGHPFVTGADGWRIAGVTAMQGYLRERGTWDAAGSADPPRPGDVITFRDTEHVGIVESVKGDTIRTIEGNTSNQVGRRSYARTSPEVDGWGRMASAA